MSWLVCPSICAKALLYVTYICRNNEGINFLSHASIVELIAYTISL
jgi:hypothetical protein